MNLTANARQEDWVDLLTYLTAPGAAPSLTTPERIAGLTLVATDADWQYGSGPEIAGTLEALTMAVTGRRHALDDVAGPGGRETSRPDPALSPMPNDILPKRGGLGPNTAQGRTEWPAGTSSLRKL